MKLLRLLNETMSTDEWKEHHKKLAHGPDSDDWTYDEYMEWYTTSDLFKAVEQVNAKLEADGKEKDIQLTRLSQAFGDKKSSGVRPGIIKRLKHLGYKIPEAKKAKIKDIASD
jgi:hypothetical protein